MVLSKDYDPAESSFQCLAPPSLKSSPADAADLNDVLAVAEGFEVAGTQRIM
jgi:hypothetical protein